MHEDTLIWLFGVLGVWCLTLTGIWFHTKMEVKRIRLAVEMFIDGIGKGASMVLHSPTNHLGMDALIDKYVKDHDLDFEEWLAFRELCRKAIADPEVDKEQTGFAIMVHALCEHKLQRYGIRPGSDDVNPVYPT